MTLAASLASLFSGAARADAPVPPPAAAPAGAPAFAQHLQRLASARTAPSPGAPPQPREAGPAAPPPPPAAAQQANTPPPGGQPTAQADAGEPTSEDAGEEQGEPAPAPGTEAPAWWWALATPQAESATPREHVLSTQAELVPDAADTQAGKAGRTRSPLGDARDGPEEDTFLRATRGEPEGILAVSDGEHAFRSAALVEAVREPGAPPAHGSTSPVTASTAIVHVPGAASPAAQAGFGGVERSVTTPVTSPEFPDALASQVSYLVREGVQQARLQLHPAELGPLQVHIALQGQQAQVDFVATSAVTRSAIESSLAQLAASLQQAGLTLAGGGVSHGGAGQGGQRDDGASGARAPLRADAPEAAPPSPAPRAGGWRQGSVDYYA